VAVNEILDEFRINFPAPTTTTTTKTTKTTTTTTRKRPPTACEKRQAEELAISETGLKFNPSIFVPFQADHSNSDCHNTKKFPQI
jgi:hypothetical protein